MSYILSHLNWLNPFFFTFASLSQYLKLVQSLNPQNVHHWCVTDDKYELCAWDNTMCASVQSAQCGEGFRRRNLSCVVHWGDWPESPPQPVAEELCGDKLKQQMQQELKQPCFVPCSGKPVHKYTGLAWNVLTLTEVVIQVELHDLYNILHFYNRFK